MTRKRFYDYEMEVAIENDTGPVEVAERAFDIFAERLALVKVENEEDVLYFRVRRFKKFTYDEIYFIAFMGKNSIELSVTKQVGWSRDKRTKVVIRYGKKEAYQIANEIFDAFHKLYSKLQEQPWLIRETFGTKWWGKDACPTCGGRVRSNFYPYEYICKKCARQWDAR